MTAHPTAARTPEAAPLPRSRLRARLVLAGFAAAGLTARQAQRRGLRVASAELDLANAIARPWTYEKDPRGHLGLLADADRKILIGAWAVGPMAGEWIHQASLAIRAQIPVDTLLDQVAQFPTYHEAYHAALEKLDL